MGRGDRPRSSAAEALAQVRRRVIALRPECDGQIRGYDGADEVWRRFEGFIIDSHLPPPGTPTQPVSAGYMANAWLRMKHYDYDTLREMLDFVGRTLKVRAS